MRCRSCDAVLQYTPGLPSLSCRHCGAEQPLPDEPAPAKQDFREVLAEHLARAERPETPTLSCRTCGAETTAAPSVLSTRCAFCGSPELLRDTGPRLRPASVLPFALDDKQARAALGAWERALWWKPGPLFDAAALSLSPVYLPYWGFDWDASTDYTGERGTDVNRSTRWEEARGTVRTKLDAQLVFASRSLPRELLSDLEPFDTEHLQAWQDEHLLGVHAETAGEDVTAGADLAHRLLERRIEHDIRGDIGGDHQRITERATRYHAIRCQLHLLPVWIARYRHRETEHRVFVNGRTGEVIGERPTSQTRVIASIVAPIVLPVVAAVGFAARAPAAVGRTALAAFWGVLLVQSLLLMFLRGRAPKKAPVRQRQFFLTRPSADRGLEVSPVEIAHGVMQDDARSRAAFFGVLGFAGVFVSLFPFFTLVTGAPPAMVIAAHAFSAAGAAAFTWATWASFRDKRHALGLDELRRRR